MRPSSPGRTRRAAGAGSSIGPVPPSWPLARGDVRFHASLTPFRHLGFFPDMAPQWDFMRERSRRRRRAQPVRLYRRRHAVAVRRRRADGPCRCFEEVGRGRPRQRHAVGDGRPADPLDRRRRRQVHRARSPPRAPLRRHLARPAQVRARPDRRIVAARGSSRAVARRLPQAARRRQPLPRADGLCGADVGAGDRRIARPAHRRPWRHASSAAKWRCARNRAACSSRPPSSRAGAATRSALPGSPRRSRTALRRRSAAPPPPRA